LFKYMKTKYENIYEWMKNNPDASCFYCGKQRDPDEMAHRFFVEGNVGICKLCMSDFRIGHLAADRHVVERILAEKGYKRKVDVLNWFKRQGYELFEAGEFGEDDYKGTAYNFINDIDSWNELQAEIKAHGRLPNGFYMDAEETKRMNAMFDSATRIEIYNSGGVHIVY
jgi:hypothetical protein